MLNNNSNSYTSIGKTVTYVRTAGYDSAGDVINKQLSKLHDFAAENNMLILKDYIDNGFSGHTHNRPAFMQMIEDAQQNPEWDTILICDVSRVYRNAKIGLEYIEYFKSYGIQVVTASGKYEPVTGFDICRPLLETIESSIKSERRTKKCEVTAHE